MVVIKIEVQITQLILFMKDMTIQVV